MKNNEIDMVRLESMERYGFGPHIMKKIKVCERCGRTSPASENFCRECGNRLPEKTLYQSYKERHKYCKKCETVLSDSSEYCPQCGAKF